MPISLGLSDSAAYWTSKSLKGFVYTVKVKPGLMYRNQLFTDCILISPIYTVSFLTRVIFYTRQKINVSFYYFFESKLLVKLEKFHLKRFPSIFFNTFFSLQSSINQKVSWLLQFVVRLVFFNWFDNIDIKSITRVENKTVLMLRWKIFNPIQDVKWIGLK